MKSFSLTPFGLLSLLCALFFACSSPDNHNETEPQGTVTLNVGLYPYVPRLQQMQDTLEAQWKKLQPDVELNFVPWDCYSSPKPPQDLHVFVFDAIYATQYYADGYLHTFPSAQLQNPGDFLPYALQGCAVNEGSDTLLAAPQIGCTNMMFVTSTDKPLIGLTTWSRVYGILGPANYNDTIAPLNEGFMMDLSGKTTDACLYVSSWEQQTGQYSFDPPLPSSTSLDPFVKAYLQQMMKAASPQQAAYSGSDPYIRTRWFSEGYSRSTVGFTESMSDITGNRPFTFQVLPVSNAQPFNLFYVDMVGINSSLDNQPNLLAYATQLRNLMVSTDYILGAFGKGGGVDSPQFLMPVRASAFHALGEQSEIYGKMYDVAVNGNPKAFRLGANVRSWIATEGAAIRDTIFRGGFPGEGLIAHPKDAK